MAKPLGITIPDGLYKRLQTVKNRINVSGVCQEAIEQEVKKQQTEVLFEEELKKVRLEYERLTTRK